MRLAPKDRCLAYRNRDRLIGLVEDMLAPVEPDLAKRQIHWSIVPSVDADTDQPVSRWTAVFVLGPDAMFMARTIAERGFFVTNCC